MTDKTEQPETKTPAAGKNAQTVQLPDGRTAVVEEAYGRHLVTAGRMAGTQDPMKIMMGLIAATTTIDGKALTIEDVEDLPLSALNPLMQKVGGGNAPSLPGSTSLN